MVGGFEMLIMESGWCEYMYEIHIVNLKLALELQTPSLLWVVPITCGFNKYSYYAKRFQFRFHLPNSGGGTSLVIITTSSKASSQVTFV